MRDQAVQGLQSASIDRHLGLDVVASQDVANRAEARHRNGHLMVLEQLNDTGQHVRLQDNRDLSGPTIRNVREGPANVADNLLRIVFDQNFSEGGDTASDLLVIRSWSTTT